MTTPNNGGAAFPALNFIVPHDLAEAGVRRLGETQGMTLRDFFAAKALPAVIAAYVEANGRCIGTDHVKYNCAGHAYAFADAMLAERSKS